MTPAPMSNDGFPPAGRFALEPSRPQLLPSQLLTAPTPPTVGIPFASTASAMAESLAPPSCCQLPPDHCLT